jgi:hypothetical protein
MFGCFLEVWEFGVRTLEAHGASWVEGRPGGKENVLAVVTDSTNYVFMSQHQNIRRGHHTNTHNSSYKRVEQFENFVTNLSNQNYIELEIKSGLKSGNVFYHPVKTF